MPSRGVVHYGDGHQPKCRPKVPFTYFAWSTNDPAEVTCERCLAWIERHKKGQTTA